MDLARHAGTPTGDRCLSATRLGVAVAALVWSTLLIGGPLAGPNALLVGATLREARNFAVDLAYGRGWSVPSLGHASATFELVIEDDDTNDPHGPQRLIRVTARFSEEPTGVRVVLEAQEIAMRDNQVRTQDVSVRYAENLTNALRSLVAKWNDYLEQRDGSDRWGLTGGARLPARAGSRPSDPVAFHAKRPRGGRGCMSTAGEARPEAEERSANVALATDPEEGSMRIPGHGGTWVS